MYVKMQIKTRMKMRVSTERTIKMRGSIKVLRSKRLFPIDENSTRNVRLAPYSRHLAQLPYIKPQGKRDLISSHLLELTSLRSASEPRWRVVKHAHHKVMSSDFLSPFSVALEF